MLFTAHDSCVRPHCARTQRTIRIGAVSRGTKSSLAASNGIPHPTSTRVQSRLHGEEANHAACEHTEEQQQQNHRQPPPVVATNTSTRTCATLLLHARAHHRPKSSSPRATHHHHHTAPCTTTTPHNNAAWQGGVTAAVAMLSVLAGLPDAAVAGETLPLEVVQAFLEQIEALGPWGAVAFVVTVSLAEMIPLFPTQPLSLAGGLLFGATYGGALVLLGTSIAAVAAFTVSRTVGKDFAQRVINSEMGEAEEGASGGLIKSQLQRVYNAIDGGGFWQQYAAIAVLRLTPVVPFSAGNYLLGLTPLPYAPFVAGSLTGMTVWSFLYASVGGASRALLLRGADLESLFADMADRAGSVTEKAAVVALIAGAAAAAAWSLGLLRSDTPVDPVDSLTNGQQEGEKAATQEKSRSFVKDRV